MNSSDKKYRTVFDFRNSFQDDAAAKKYLFDYKCSAKHLQAYLDEFFFRHNRRNNLDTIFEKLMNSMMDQKPFYINKLTLD